MLEEVLQIKTYNDDETIAQLRRTNQPVFIYGAGVMARRIYEDLLKRGINNIKLVVDDKNKAAVDPVLSRVEIRESQDLDADYKDYIVIIGFYAALFDVAKFTRQFKNASQVKAYLNTFDSLEELTPDYFQKHYDKFESVYRLLTDDESRICMLAYLKGKISSDHSYLQPHLSRGLQYFSEDFLKLSDHESYVDCGAYDGNSLRDFWEMTAGRYTHIWAFEPDPGNFQLLSSLVASKRWPEVTLIEAGTSSEKARLPFAMDHGQGSRLEENADTFVECDTIDNVSEGREVTFIKMDIEGSELAALKGAETVIKRYRPNLAISAYHRADDFFALSGFIQSLCPEYKFYVRLYGPFDAVLFATVR